MQWSLLPPTSFTSKQVTIAGMLEPAMSIAGDSFDYAMDGSVAHLAVFDAMGHGLPSAMQVSAAVGAYRNARRSMLSLEETMRLLEDTLTDPAAEARFVTALLLELDVDTGALAWSLGGPPGRPGPSRPPPRRHPRCGSDASPRARAPRPPADRPSHAGARGLGARLHRRGRGVPPLIGDYFTVERLADFVTRETAAGRRTPETLRRLAQAILHYQNGVLQDDATVLMATWHGSNGESTD